MFNTWGNSFCNPLIKVKSKEEWKAETTTKDIPTRCKIDKKSIHKEKQNHELIDESYESADNNNNTLNLKFKNTIERNSRINIIEKSNNNKKSSNSNYKKINDNKKMNIVDLMESDNEEKVTLKKARQLNVSAKEDCNRNKNNENNNNKSKRIDLVSEDDDERDNVIKLDSDSEIEEDDFDLIERKNNKRIKPESQTSNIATKIYVEKIFLGMMEFKSSLIPKTYIIIDVFSKIKNLKLIYNDDLEIKEEIINFAIIKQVNFGSLREPYQGLRFISILLDLYHYGGTNRLKYVSVGGNKMIDPNLSDYASKEYKHRLSSKYILIVLETNKIDGVLQIFRDDGIPTKCISERDKIDSHLKALLRKDQVDEEELISKNKSDLETQSRRATRSSATTIAEDPNDHLTFVIFPMTPEAQDVITIHRGDMKRFNACEYFNDNLIDLKIKHMIMDLTEDKKKKVYAFSCLFYAKLTELSDPKEAHALIARWTKNVNLFDLDYIFIPINLTLHWSLVVICKPEQWIQLKINNNESNNDNNEACFIHMDSLDMHPTNSIAKVITNYLSNEYRAKIKLTTENDSDENLFQKMPRVSPLCPKQENGYDCGVYVIKYVEKVLSLFPTTAKSDRSSKLASHFSNNMFSPEDITKERVTYKQLLTDLSFQWELQKKKESEKEELEAKEAKEKKEEELKTREAVISVKDVKTNESQSHYDTQSQVSRLQEEKSLDANELYED